MLDGWRDWASNYSFSILIYSSFVLLSFLLMLQSAWKYRQQGRNYIVEDGDIIFFKFNAGAGVTVTKKK